MTLFPQLSDSYYVDNDNNILKLMDYTYAKNIQINQSFWSEADQDSRFVAGDQSIYNDIYGNIPSFRRRQFNFNRLRRVVNMISGKQRQNRKQTTCTPVENSDNTTADQFTKLLFHVNTRGRILETISDSFEGSVITGMNLLSVWMDWRNDPVNGDICVDNVSYNGYLIDPYFKKMDLSDCNNIWTRKYLSKNQVKSLLPGREKDIDGLMGWGNRDGKFQFLPESYNYGMQDLIIYDEFWYLDSRKQKLMIDTMSGECMEWQGNDDDLREFLRFYPQIILQDTMIPTVKLAISVQGKVFYHGPNPLNIDKYPFVPTWAYYDPQIPYFPWRVQGVIRGLRDSQYLYNRRRIIELDILESQVTSGWLFKENAPVNPKDMFIQGQGRSIPVKQESDLNADFKRMDPPQIPPSMIQLSELLAKEITEISGINEELLGSATDDKAGILSMLRQGAGLVTLQKLFDNLDQSQRMLGQMCIDLIQKNWTPGKVARILGEEPSQQFYNRAFGKYDCIVEEAPLTATQKKYEFMQLFELKQAGLPIPIEAIMNASTFQNKDKIIAQMQQAEQAQAQMQQKQAEAETAVLQGQLENLKAQAMANEGLGYERASRVAENQALAIERVAAAEKDREQAALDQIKAAKELTSMDLDHLARAIEIIQSIKQRNSDEAKEAANMEKVTNTQQSA